MTEGEVSGISNRQKLIKRIDILINNKKTHQAIAETIERQIEKNEAAE